MAKSKTLSLYTDAEALVASQKEYQVDLAGPTAKDYRWQAREQGGYALADFSIDWEQKQARCPQGQISSSWTPTWTRNQEIIKIKFGFATCGRCPARAHCTKTKRRTLSVRRQEAHFALKAARQREQTEEFTELYAQRAGIEGVHAQGTRRMGLRRSRYVGEPRTHLQHTVIATAMNLCRLHDWLTGVSPHATPLSHFRISTTDPDATPMRLKGAELILDTIPTMSLMEANVGSFWQCSSFQGR